MSKMDGKSRQFTSDEKKRSRVLRVSTNGHNAGIKPWTKANRNDTLLEKAGLSGSPWGQRGGKEVNSAGPVWGGRLALGGTRKNFRIG